MANILGHIISGTPEKISGNKHELTYNCSSTSEIYSPVKGTIDASSSDNDKIVIKGDNGGVFEIFKVNWAKPPADKLISLHEVITGATPDDTKIYLKATTEDLSPLYTKSSENNDKKLSSGLGMSSAEAKDMTKNALRGTIGVSNAPYQAALDVLIKSKVVKEGFNEIKDNVLSEELKRIKSLF